MPILTQIPFTLQHCTSLGPSRLHYETMDGLSSPAGISLLEPTFVLESLGPEGLA